MNAAMVTAVSALIAGPLAAAAAMYGSRGATRATREGTALTGYDNLTQRLIAERDKAELDEKTAEARATTAEAQATAAEARVAGLEAEIARLRLLVTQLGGTP
ncbi:hypothetical protein AB0N17_02865 [Streptomyces sp. NPDC051133]|uniref:hypothetical protein n=1 Tax=Streptomyces sp. NPDC051133 TaxID=3155521 RepID=UPI00343846FD